MMTFCSGPPFCAEQLEQVLAHRGRAQFDEQLVVEVLAGVFVLGQVGLGERACRCLMSLTPAARISSLVKIALVDAGLALDDLAGGEIAVFLGLDQRVFVDRLAEILVVVGGDLLVLGRGVLRFLQLARRGGEADVDGVGVALEHLRPAAPGGAVALVDDDDAEGILAVVLGEEAGEAFVLVVQAEGLVGGDVDAGVAGGVAAAARS